MGFSSNVNMLRAQTIFTPFPGMKIIPAVIITLLISVLLVVFLSTRLGLSIRATGDNPDMVRASSINTGLTITIGLAISNSITALSGAVLAQYQKTADISLGTGMVIIGLASLIIGETVFRRGKLWVKVLGAVVGCIVYRFIIALALRLDLPSECLKLVSAVIVAVAIALPTIRKNKGGK
jgi:putative ABC transport system permease protein